MRVTLNELESRIVAVLAKRYPVTTDELREELSIRHDTLDRVLKGLAARGVLMLEPLPDKTYIRLLISVSEAGGKRPVSSAAEPGDDESIAYR